MMKNNHSILFALFIFPVTVLSTQQSPTVRTSVTTTGNGAVKVQTNVESRSNSTTSVSVKGESTSKTTDGDSSVYKRIEVDVNGEKRLVESTESGTTAINFGIDNASQEAKIAINNKLPIYFKKEEITIAEYIAEIVQKWLGELFQGLRLK